MRDFLDGKCEKEDARSEGKGGGGEDGGNGKDAAKNGERQEKPNGSYGTLKKAAILVRHNERPARLILDRRPLVEGSAWLRYDNDGQEAETNLIDVVLVALVEG